MSAAPLLFVFRHSIENALTFYRSRVKRHLNRRLRGIVEFNLEYSVRNACADHRIDIRRVKRQRIVRKRVVGCYNQSLRHVGRIHVGHRRNTRRRKAAGTEVNRYRYRATGGEGIAGRRNTRRSNNRCRIVQSHRGRCRICIVEGHGKFSGLDFSLYQRVDISRSE